jgi:hypothetical protein
MILNLTIYSKSLFQLIASSRPSSLTRRCVLPLNGSITTRLSPQPLNLMASLALAGSHSVIPEDDWEVRSCRFCLVSRTLSAGACRWPAEAQTPHSVQAHIGHLGYQAKPCHPSLSTSYWNNQSSHIQRSPSMSRSHCLHTRTTWCYPVAIVFCFCLSPTRSCGCWILNCLKDQSVDGRYYIPSERFMAPRSA